jgi:type VI secretion system secreted protein VgrG
MSSSPGRTQANAPMAIATPLGDDVLLLAQLSGREELGRLFEYTLELLSDESEINFEDLIGQNVTIRIEAPGGETRYINGLVSRFVQTGFEPGAASYQAVVVPWLWFLTRTSDCRIFQNRSVPDIIKQVLNDQGFSDIEMSLTGNYPEREYCVQYRETDFDFISRLMEHEGIYYYFKHEDGKHTLVLVDAPTAHAPDPEAAEVRFHIPSEGELAGEYIYEWTLEKAAQPGRYSVNDFDFENPLGSLESKSSITREHAAANFEIYDYPGKYATTAEGERFARTRLDELHAGYERAHAASDVRALVVGNTFTLTDHPRPDQNRDYLIVAAEYAASCNDYGSGQDDGEDTYTCTFTAIPAAQQFRPARLTRRPQIRGPQTAIVVGKIGEEIWTDEFGRVKVQFPWDRYSRADETSSCWVRVAQSVAGKKWGSIFLPRIGQEVIIEFLDGDPDRPIITGRVYNGVNKPPYDLPADATKSGLKSSSSKGGGGFNELRFEDKAGEEQIFMHAQLDMHTRVLNDECEWVGNDRHLIVKNDQIELVENNRGEKVVGDHAEEIGKDRHLKVKGNEAKHVVGQLSLSVDGDVVEVVKGKQSTVVTGDYYLKADTIVIEAKTNITIKVGGTHIAIEAGGITIGTSGTVEITAGGTMDLKSTGPLAASSDATAELTSSATTVNGDGMLTLKGGMVKIN